MTETEMLKELRIIVAKVAHVDQAPGRAPAHVLQAKEKVRRKLRNSSMLEMAVDFVRTIIDSAFGDALPWPTRSTFRVPLP